MPGRCGGLWEPHRPKGLVRKRLGCYRLWLHVETTLFLIPNSESVGFQSLGPGTGDTKMRAPKNRNSPGTLLEPFTVGLQSWANVFVATK